MGEIMASTGELESTATDLARECLYRFLATAVSDPYLDQWRLVRDSASQRLFSDAAALVRTESASNPASLGFGELGSEHMDADAIINELQSPMGELCAQHDRVFGLVQPRECPPYETEYHPNSEAFFRAQQLADIAGFYRAFGIQPGSSPPERPDHLSLELEFMSFLLLKKRTIHESGKPQSDEREKIAICESAQRAFFTDHLAWWVPAFARGLRRKAGDGLYAALGRFLGALMPAERARWDIPAPRLPLQPHVIERPEEQESCVGCN